MPSLPGTLDRSLVVGILTLFLLTTSFATGITTHQAANATAVFVADDLDPDIDALPPFIQPDLRAILQSNNISAATASRIRDFTYPTSQPSYEVGPHDRTLAEYRRSNLNQLPHNRSTSV